MGRTVRSVFTGIMPMNKELGKPSEVFNEDKVKKILIDTIQNMRGIVLTKSDNEQIAMAVQFLLKFLGPKHRMDYHPAALHSIRVAIKCVTYYKIYDKEMIMAALLHDVVEDSKVSIDEVRKKFGYNVAYLVDGLTKYKFAEEDVSKMVKEATSLIKLILFAQKDIRIILIKFMDRIDNIETIRATPNIQKIVKTKETFDIYIPIADALNMWKVKMYLENLAFKIQYGEFAHLVYEEFYNFKSEKFKGTNSEAYIKGNIIKKIARELKKRKIKIMNFKYREKSLYGIHKKMQKVATSIDLIYDLFGIKVIVDREIECYQALEAIQKIFPTFIRVKDYIKNPKNNGYKSIHLDIQDPKLKIWIELQIKTDEMEAYNEYGPAAHPLYKGWEFHSYQFQDIGKVYEILENVLKSRRLNPEILDINVLTPAGDKITLPYGSTVLDLAYRIHSDIGYHCKQAKINRAEILGELIVSPEEILHDGDRIEIIVDPETHPAIDWLLHVRTHDAFKSIKNWLYHYYNSEEIGNALSRSIADLEKKGRNSPIYSVVKSIYKDIYPADLKKIKKDPVKTKLPLTTMYKVVVPKTGEEIVDFKLALCCSPLHGEPIVGIRSKGGMVIHKENCVTAGAKAIPIRWATDHNAKKWKTKIYFSLEQKTDRRKAQKKLEKILKMALSGYEGYYENLEIQFSSGDEQKTSSGYIFIDVNTSRVTRKIKEAFLDDKSISGVLPNCW